MKFLFLAFTLLIFSSSLFAQDLGSIKWDVDEGISGTPAIGADSTIYYTNGTKLRALNNDGTIKWSYQALNSKGNPATLSGSPAIATDGTIYFNSTYHRLFAVNPDSTLKWAVEVGKKTDYEMILSSPAIAADGTIIVTTNYKMHAYNPDGSLKWDFNAGGSGYGSPVVDANGIIFVGTGKYLKAISPAGVELWKFDANGGAGNSSPAIGADGTIYIATASGVFCAVNSDGTEKWLYSTVGTTLGSPLIDTDGTIYIYSYDGGTLFAINPDGTEKWTKEILAGQMSGVQNGPTLGADSVLYIGGTTTSFKTKYFAINSNDGSIKWSTTLNDKILEWPAAITTDGTVLAGNTSVLYAFNSESGGLANSVWPKVRNNMGNTGYTSVTTSIEQISVKTPENFSLSEAYPNPFNPSTNITFTISKNDNVKISVYDIRGKQVENLLNENKSAGSYKLTWNASNFVSGIYFIKIQFNGLVQTRKCMLIK